MESKTERFIWKHMATFMTVVTFASLSIAQELVSRFIKAGVFLPLASEVITKFIGSFMVPISKYTIPVRTGTSLYRVGAAFIIATLTGTAPGVLMGYSKTAGATIKPVFGFIRPTSPLAWTPMSIPWFGLGDQSKSFITFLSCFCFITVNTYDGTKNVGPALSGAVRIFRASGHQMFFRAVLSSSVPYILAGLQIAITVGRSAVVGAEMVRSGRGVGRLIVMGVTDSNMVQTMVGMLAIGIVEYVLVTAMAKLEGRLCIWNQQQRL